MPQTLNESMSYSVLLDRGQRQIKLTEKRRGWFSKGKFFFFSNRRGRKEREYDIYDMLDKQKTFTPIERLTDTIHP